MTTITLPRATVEQALEALEYENSWHEFFKVRPYASTVDAITALRAALAQEQAEPQCTPAWWRDGLTATLMREGINKHRAREIADGYWQAYCEIGDSDD